MAKAAKPGGNRSNSGRKPVADKKITVTCYPPQSRVDLLGMPRAKEVAAEAIENEYKKELEKIIIK